MFPRVLAASCLLLVPAAVLVPGTLSAQTGGSAQIAGTVVDSAGAGIVRADVTAHTITGAVVRTTTDASGHFELNGLLPGRYEVDVDAFGFATTQRPEVIVTEGTPAALQLKMAVNGVREQVTVQADDTNSVAAQQSPMDANLEERSARTEIKQGYIENFVSPVADYSEIIQEAPGTFSVNANGVGLGDSKTYFRGFPDGDYDITFDGIPFNDTNTPTHHSWAFFPSQWIGGVDFDRSPGTASTIGPTPFGGSINLLSRPAETEQDLRGGVTYGSFNTLLYDGNYQTGGFGPGRKAFVGLDVHHMSSDGFQTYNYQNRSAGELKFQYRFSDTRVLTGFSGVLRLNTNTPNFKGPTRAQVAANGYNFLMSNDPTQATYYKYNFYYVPTDFEYVGFRSGLGKGWMIDTRPYTYSYNNHQNYTNTQTGAISVAGCSTPATLYPCGTDKLNSYRKYGETTTVSQVSKYGIFRTGFWYEWATTDRYQIPQNPLTGADSVLPNFHETFYTNSYQPFAEYEYHPTGKLTVVGGLKFARYTQDLTQYADNGKTIGSTLPGTKTPFTAVYNSGAYNSYLPSGDANYRIRNNWSVYGQVATGSIIPPSSVFDVAGGKVNTFPQPTRTLTYQTGSVVKLNRATFDVDYFHIRFGNTYTAIADANVQSGYDYFSSGDSVSQGFEGETNIALLHGLNLYMNGTVGSARYVSQTVNGAANVNYQHWVANTPANTEGFGLTYSRKGMDFGVIDKRVGPMWNDNSTFNQVVPIAPFQITNLFFNYTVRSQSHLDGTKLRLSFNNLFNTENIISVNPATKGATFVPAAGDTLGLTPGRSVSLTVTFGYAPKR